MPRYIITLGSSHAQGLAYIKKAMTTIKSSSTMALVGKSKIYKNGSAQTLFNLLFYNTALAITTTLAPHTLYRELVALEFHGGRLRSFRNAPRTIDIDVLMSLDLVYTAPHFSVPHKQAWERNFFVIPAVEALKSAGWPLPQIVSKSSMKFGCGYLQPVTAT